MSLAQHGPIESHVNFDNPKAYAAHLMAQSGSSFTLGMKMLSKEKREAIFSIYAFCRAVDDIADEEGNINEKRLLLQNWRNEIEALFKGAPRSLIGRALLDPVKRYTLPKQEFLLMIEGMEKDVNGPVIAPSMDELLSYTRCVAGTVGMMAIRIFGVSDKKERDLFALHLADAFQLTNILRDIEEDAALGRLYLPLDLLEKHNITERDPIAVSKNPALPTLCKDLGTIARDRFNQARIFMHSLKGEPLRTAIIMMGVYETYLDKMEEEGFKRNPSLYKLSKGQKLLYGLRYGFLFPKRTLSQAPIIIPPIAKINLAEDQ